MSDHDAEHIRKQVRIYVAVFAALAVLTLLTVAVSYLHLSVASHITLALLIAILKGSLVVLFFMHLISERRAIYYVLSLVLVMFFMVMWVPTHWWDTEVTTDSIWNKIPVAEAAGHGGGQHGDGHHGDEHHE